MSIDTIARAIAYAAARHGATVTVATTLEQAMDAPAGSATVTLSAGPGGSVDVIRAAMPHEGGALHHHRVEGWRGAMPTATARWIEAWAMDVAAAERFGLALAAAGVPPQGLPPWGVRVDAAAETVLASAGVDVGAMLAQAEWRVSQTGFSMSRSVDDTTIDADRYLDGVRFTLLRLDAGGRTIGYEQVGEEARIHLRAPEAIPHTVLDGAVGRALSCLLSTERAEPPPNVVRNAVQMDGELSITTDIHPRRIAIPQPENAA